MKVVHVQRIRKGLIQQLETKFKRFKDNTYLTALHEPLTKSVCRRITDNHW